MNPDDIPIGERRRYPRGNNAYQDAIADHYFTHLRPLKSREQRLALRLRRRLGLDALPGREDYVDPVDALLGDPAKLAEEIARSVSEKDAAEIERVRLLATARQQREEDTPL